MCENVPELFIVHAHFLDYVEKLKTSVIDSVNKVPCI